MEGWKQGHPIKVESYVRGRQMVKPMLAKWSLPEMRSLPEMMLLVEMK